MCWMITDFFWIHIAVSHYTSTNILESANSVQLVFAQRSNYSDILMNICMNKKLLKRGFFFVLFLFLFLCCFLLFFILFILFSVEHVTRILCLGV